MKTKTCIFAILLAAGLTSSRAQDTWTQKADFGGTARSRAVGFSIGSKGYVGTGSDADGLKKDFWEYDPSTNGWTQKADFGGTARFAAAGFSIGSKGYIGTGLLLTYTYPKDFWEYDPASNTWTQKAGFRKRYQAIGFSIGSKGYIGTGFDSITLIKDFSEYDPSTNTWAQKADFGGAGRDGAAGFSIGSKGYIGTGGSQGLLDKDFWEYDPSTNTWAQKADFGGAGRDGAIGFSIDSKGYIGTGLGNDFWEYTPATAQTNPVPLINQPLVPDATAPGGQGFTLTVNGTGFVSGSVVNWNGSARATTFVSNSQLTATILASDIAGPNTASVTVVNLSPGGGTSNVVFFPITLPSSSITLSRSDFALSPGPAGVAAGDFNGDGKPDLAVANYGSNTVSILLGNGDGTFQTHVDYATGAAPDSPVVGDFNGDGLLDVVVRSQNSNQVSLLLGNGDGTFQTVANFAAGSGNGSVAVGDFNGDGRLDLVSTSAGENMVYILLGKGDGTFQSAVAYPTGSFPYGIAVGDLNEDGKLDLAINDLNGDAVSILLGNGDGTFQPHVDYAAGTGPIWINVADLNADGALDLVVPNTFTNTVSILLGNGNGTFQHHVDYALGSGGGRSCVADFNGDGKLDLAVTGSPGLVFLLLGNGDGTFQLSIGYATGASPLAVAVGDFNGDGRLDLGATNINDNSISVLLQATTVALSDTNLKFDPQLVGTTSTAQTVTLTNSGPITLTISSIVASGDFIAENNCGSSVPAGASCTIRVAFRPSAKGVRTGRVTITDDAANSPQIIKLKGIGTVVQVSPSALDFGDQVVGTTSDPLTATITNISSEDLHISGVGISGANFGDFAETTTCRSRLAAGGSCTIDVTFTPGARGDRHASLKIVDDGGASPQAVPLTGTGVPR